MIVSRKAWFIHVISNPIIGGRERKPKGAVGRRVSRDGEVRNFIHAPYRPSMMARSSGEPWNNAQRIDLYVLDLMHNFLATTTASARLVVQGQSAAL